MSRKHRAHPVWVSGDGWDEPRTIELRCVYCGKPIQRQGLLRRWRHVT